MTITSSTVSRVLAAVLSGLILARSAGHPFAQDVATANVRAIYAAGLAAYEKKDCCGGGLRKLAALTLYYDVLNDKDFAGVRAHPAIQVTLRLIASRGDDGATIRR